MDSPKSVPPEIAGSVTLPAGTRLGAYSIQRVLGRGGTGVVYEAVHNELGKRAAIKMLHPEYAQVDEVRSRFLREGRAVARIHHPNVVEMYDVSEYEGIPYLVMEFLEGHALSEHIADGEPLTPRTAADILVPVIAAVSAAHQHGIVHRDLKPENIIMVPDRSGTLQPKVVDFGISKLNDDDAPRQNLTANSAILGTPDYMSPEQAEAATHVDARTDQFSLGVILYELLTGQRPFQGESLYKLLHAIAQGDYIPAGQLQPTIPQILDSAIVRAMAREPERRFSSVAALGQKLLSFASEKTRMLYQAELEAKEPDAGAIDPTGPTHRPPASAPHDPISSLTPVGISLAGDRAPVSSRPVAHSPRPPTAYRPAPATSPSSSGGLWVGLGVVILAVAGGGVYFALTQGAAQDDELQKDPATTRAPDDEQVKNAQAFARFVGKARKAPRKTLDAAKPSCKSDWCSATLDDLGTSRTLRLAADNEWALRIDSTLPVSVTCSQFGGATQLKSWTDTAGQNQLCKMLSGPMKGLYLWLAVQGTTTRATAMGKAYISADESLPDELRTAL